MVSTQQHSHKRILLIEDNFPARELMSMILGSGGYMVSTAANGESALQRLRTFEHIDLILLDQHEPNRDGWEFREELNQTPEFASIPMLVLSGNDKVGERSSTLAAIRFLHRPFETATLLQTIQQCCG